MLQPSGDTVICQIRDFPVACSRSTRHGWWHCFGRNLQRPIFHFGGKPNGIKPRNSSTDMCPSQLGHRSLPWPVCISHMAATSTAVAWSASPAWCLMKAAQGPTNKLCKRKARWATLLGPQGSFRLWHFDGECHRLDWWEISSLILCSWRMATHGGINLNTCHVWNRCLNIETTRHIDSSLISRDIKIFLKQVWYMYIYNRIP